MDESHPEFANYDRYSVPGGWYSWGEHYDRFNISREPNAANRYGWVVEVDPSDPASTPKKRTALGRTKHEGAESVVNGDSRVVVYSGDDERFDYVYKFVTEGAFDEGDPATNADLLDAGTLYVRASTPTGPSLGCRSCMAKALSCRKTASTIRATF